VLTPFCDESPELILKIIDCLWDEPEVEMRELATQLLGRLPQSHFKEVIHRILDWSMIESDAELLPFLHKNASTTIRQEAPDQWLAVLNSWNSASEPWLAKLAIDGTIP